MTQTQTRSMPDDALSAEVLRSLAEGRQIPCLTTRDGGLSLSRAYRIGALIEAARVGQGSQVVGRKIGFTNKTIWDEFNVSAPIFGPMYDSTVRPLGVPFPLTGLMEPRIEPEIAFRLAAAPEPGMAPSCTARSGIWIRPNGLTGWNGCGISRPPCRGTGWFWTGAMPATSWVAGLWSPWAIWRIFLRRCPTQPL